LGQGLLIIHASQSHLDTTLFVDSSGRVISPTQKPLPQNTTLHVSGGVRTHNPRNRAAANPPIRLHSHWNLHPINKRLQYIFIQ